MCDCEDGEEVLIEAVVCTKLNNIRLKGKSMQKLLVRDETDSCVITWFNKPYLKDKFIVRKKI